MIPSTQEAVAASVEVASALGLLCQRPVVVAEGYSVRVRLDPAPVLTRVITRGQALRGDPLPWLRRELAVSGWLAREGMPVAEPWDDAGPHVARGLPVTLWRWLESTPEPVGPEAFGRLLGQLHEALLDYPDDLPVLVGPLTDIAAALRTTDHALLQEAAARLVPQALSWPRRPLHGDAHTGNVLVTPSGPCWIDLEDACVGPVEWDLASLTLTDASVDAYPGDVDRERLEDCRDLRHLQVLAALLTDDVQHPSLCDTVMARLRRRQDG